MNNIDILLITYMIIGRIFELILSNRNTNKLKKKGAVECFSFHYKFIVIFHSTFLAFFFFKSLYGEYFNLSVLLIFILIQFLRYKVIFDLGRFWTTRIIVLENQPMIKKGIYKYFKHPNYFVVFAEILLVCLFFADFYSLFFFSILNLILIYIRIYYEERANFNRKRN